jgi:hypothetical protein
MFKGCAALILAFALVPPASGREILEFSLSPDDTMTVVVTKLPFEVRIVTDSGSRIVPMPNLGLEHPGPEPEISWSPDSRFFAIHYMMTTESDAVEVVDASIGKVVWGGAAPDAEWLDRGHVLLLVPHFDVGEFQSRSGLIRLDAATLEERIVAPGYYFTGYIKAGGSHVVGYVDQPDGNPSLMKVDLESSSGAELTVNHDTGAQSNSVPARLLDAILSRDGGKISAIANNPNAFNANALQFLIGPPEFTFHGPETLHSASTILRGREIVTDVSMQQAADGSRVLDILYFPKEIAPTREALRARGADAVAFRDFVACRVEVALDGATRMPHACYAETDGL